MFRQAGGGFRLHYDPQLAVSLRGITADQASAGEAALWYAYDAIRCPTLLLRGADSDLLARETALAMTQRGPKAHLHEFTGVGHAPMLTVPGQVDVVREFLLTP
jgi:pimeloyl-ACP methyl ester carboxylesterase